MSINKEKRRLKIRKSIRAKISGTKERPRVSVFKSNKAVYAQIIDDMSGNTMVSCSSVEIKKFGKNNVESSKEVGLKLAEKAKRKVLKKFYLIEVDIYITVKSSLLQKVQERED